MDDSQSLASIQMAVEAILRLMEVSNSSPKQKQTTADDVAKVMAAKNVEAANKAVTTLAKNIDISDAKYIKMSKTLDANTQSIADNTESVSKFGRAVQVAEKTLSKLGLATIGVVTAISSTLIDSFKANMARSMELEKAGVGALFRSVDGVTSSTKGVIKASDDLGISLRDVAGIATQYSQGMGLIGFDSLTKSVNNSKKAFAEMGMTVAAASESVARYIENNKTDMASRNLSSNQIAQMAITSAEQTHRFGQQLKLSREELEKRAATENLDAKSQAVLSTMDDEMRARYDAMVKTNPNLARETLLSYTSELEYGTAATTANAPRMAREASGRTQGADLALQFLRSGGHSNNWDAEQHRVNKAEFMTREQIQMGGLLTTHTGFDQMDQFKSRSEATLNQKLLEEYAKGNTKPDPDLPKYVGIQTALTKLSTIIENLIAWFTSNSVILDAIEKTFTKVADTLKDFANTHLRGALDKLGDFFGKFMLKFASWIENVDVDQLILDFTNFFRGVQEFMIRVREEGLKGIFEKGMIDFFSSLPKLIWEATKKAAPYFAVAAASPALAVGIAAYKYAKSDLDPPNEGDKDQPPASGSHSAPPPPKPNKKEDAKKEKAAPAEKPPVIMIEDGKQTIVGTSSEGYLAQLVQLQNESVGLLKKLNNKSTGYAV